MSAAFSYGGSGGSIPKIYTNNKVVTLSSITTGLGLFTIPVNNPDTFFAFLIMNLVDTDGTNSLILMEGGSLAATVKGATVSGPSNDTDTIASNYFSQSICTSKGTDTYAPGTPLYAGTVSGGNLKITWKGTITTTLVPSSGFPLLNINLRVYSGQIPTFL